MARTRSIDTEALGKKLRWAIACLVLAVALRTYVEVYRLKRMTSHSKGWGLEDNLPIRYAPQGDFMYAKILTRGSATDANYFEVEETVYRNSSGHLAGKPGSAPVHWLRFQNRTYTVLEGSIGYELDGEDLKAQAGQTVVVPENSPFSYWLDTDTADERTVVRVKVEPAGEYAEQVYEALSGYSRDYGSLMTTPHWQTIIWAARQHLEFAFLHPYIRMACRYFGAPAASVFGYELTYPLYDSKPRVKPQKPGAATPATATA